MTDRLYKSRTDRVISGVAGGLAEQLNVDPSIVRVAWVVLAIVSGGIVGLVYLVMMIVVPEPPVEWPAGGAFGRTPEPPRPGDPVAGPSAVASPGLADATPDGAAPAVSPPPAGTWLGPDGRRVDGTTAAGPSSAGTPRSASTIPAATRGSRPADPGGALVLGVILILLGAFFLLKEYVPQVDLGAAWPILAVAAGVVLVVLSLSPGSSRR